MDTNNVTEPLFTTRKILANFLAIPESEIKIGEFNSYEEYTAQTFEALNSGNPSEAESMGSIGNDHIQNIVTMISKDVLDGHHCSRKVIREALECREVFRLHSADSVNRTIDLVLRLWILLNVRDDEFAPGVRSIQWDDNNSLQAFIAEQFPRPRLLREFSERMFDFKLPDNFTMVILKKYSAIKVAWTYDLSEHLELDRDHRTLKIFPLKHYVDMLRRSKVEIIPKAVIDEYMKTINLLFPSWDIKTQKYLRKEGQTFGTEAPVEYPGPLYLSDFHFWRDRLSTLHTEFCSPPPSMTQLFNDRRNVLQWYTFWFAVFVVALTVIFGVISSITACLSTKYTYEALLLARQAAVSSQMCPVVTCIYPSSTAGIR